MNIGEICTRTTVFAYKDMRVSEAAHLMLEHHVGSLVVVDESNQRRTIAGMLTDRDIVVAVVARNFDAKTMRVVDIMSGNPLICHSEDSMMDVLHQMRLHGIRRVPVADAQDTLIGIVTMDDVLEVLAEQLHVLVQIVDSERKREAHVRG
ncbi:MAG TPA: CBS domain-containing protein [Noviherbaspirillum sp.]|nr:CBS domain-containing protein [Noviherbaspirillum sp.]